MSEFPRHPERRATRRRPPSAPRFKPYPPLLTDTPGTVWRGSRAFNAIWLRPAGSPVVVRSDAQRPKVALGRPRQATDGWKTSAIRMTPVAVALALWGAALLGPVPLDHMSDFGLISVLPPTYWVALAVLTASFCWSARRSSTRGVVPLAHVVALIAILHATPTILYGTLRYSWAWKLLGIVDYTLKHGTINHQPNMLSAYSAWPGFFTLNAFLDKLSGLGSSMSYAAWGPPVNELSFLAPLILIYRTFTKDRRLIWMAIWLFYLGNWVGQDYFSPQAFAFFLYLTILGISLKWLRGRPRKRAASAGETAASPSAEKRSRAVHDYALVGLMVVATAAIATTHQLTPFMLVASLTLLAITRRIRSRSLPAVVFVITVAWVLIGAAIFPFLRQNLYWIIRSVGHPFANTSSTFIPLSKASPDQVIIAQVDRLLSAAVGGLAVLGWWRHRRQQGRPGYRDWTPALVLAIAPASAVLGNNYGGEIMFRVYLFALPFLALYAAAAFFPTTVPAPRRPPPRWLKRVDLKLATALFTTTGLLGAFMFAYYGKERANYFPPQEVAVMQKLYAQAPPGSRLIGAASNLPWAFAHYEAYHYLWFAEYPPGLAAKVARAPVTTLVDEMKNYRHAYVIFAVSESALIGMDGMMPPGAYQHIEQAVLRSPQFRVWASNPYITVVTLANQQGSST